MEQLTVIKRNLREPIKKAVMADTDLLLKLIDRFGGGITMRAFLARFDRNSQSLVRPAILQIISKHFNIPIQELTEEVPV